jgi:hypothetical protein
MLDEGGRDDEAALIMRDELAPHLATEDGIRKQVRELGALMTNTQARLDEIANRGFFDRVFANTGKDLALAMSDVVRMQQYTVALVLAALELHAHNIDALNVMRGELDALSGGLGHAARSQKENASGLLQVRETVGHMVHVIERQMVVAKNTRTVQQQLADEARAITAGVRWRANASLAIALLLAVAVLYQNFFR